jgi:diguanylate cyclase (GGDEF)-like protein
MGALLYLDLNDFKTLNDTMGHNIGDKLLQQVALDLTSSVQPSYTVARIGGDEFVVMLEGLIEDTEKATTAARAVGETILGVFPIALGSYGSDTTASVGATLFSGATDTVDDLLKQADLTMYRAKARRGNAICFFDPIMQSEVDARATLRSDLRRTLRDDEFELNYQPQVRSDDVVVGSEVLLRWNHPLRGRVPPGEFIPLAEEASLILELGRWVMERACLQLAHWANPQDGTAHVGGECQRSAVLRPAVRESDEASATALRGQSA